MSGFITIERDIWEHPLFFPSEMTEREAWMWMIARACWSDTRHRVGREMVEVPRGSFMATLRELQSVFMWRSDKKVRTFLRVLEKEGMIGRTVLGARNAPKTHITICNYDTYQTSGRTKDAPKTHERTHHGRTADAVKKENNKITNTTAEAARGEIEVLTHRENLLSAMGHDVSGITANGKVVGSHADMGFVSQWSNDLGISEQDQIAVVQEVTAKRSGEPPPVTFKYFNGAMSDFARIKNQPKLIPTTGGRNAQPASNRPDRVQRVITAAADSAPRKDWG